MDFLRGYFFATLYIFTKTHFLYFMRKVFSFCAKSNIDKYKSMLKTKSLLNKKEINEKICRYRGYYLECLDIANLLEARYKGVM